MVSGMGWLGLKKEIPTFARFLLQLLLFCLLLHFFGVPAIEKYKENRVMVVQSRRLERRMPSPAITIEARNPKSLLGWKDPAAFQDGEGLEAVCQKMNMEGSIEDCIGEGTYERADVSPAALLKNLKASKAGKWEVLGDNLWSESFNKMKRGRLFTLNPNQAINRRLQIQLNPNLVYKIRIHDPKFFLVTGNPIHIPVWTKSLFPNRTDGLPKSLKYNIFLTEVLVIIAFQISKKCNE